MKMRGKKTGKIFETPTQSEHTSRWHQTAMTRGAPGFRTRAHSPTKAALSGMGTGEHGSKDEEWGGREHEEERRRGRWGFGGAG